MNQSKKNILSILFNKNDLHVESHIRYIITPTCNISSSKISSPRHLNSTSYKTMDSIKSNEISQIGMAKHLVMSGNNEKI